MYEIYYGNAKRAVYQYKTFSRLKKRLTQMAEESALTECNVVFPMRFGLEMVTVKFNRTARNYGWSVDENGRGIPTKLGMGNFTTRQVNFVGRR